MAAGGAAVRTAADFFGASDPDGAADKFKTVAFRALHDQKIEEELTQTKQENAQLRNASAALEKQVAELRSSLEVNIEDRERVLAFKSKRIEELHGRVRDLEAINASLIETINGGRPSALPPGVGEEATGEQTRAARMSLLNAGKPLYHALDTCKELEFRRLYDDKRAQSESLLAQMARDAELVEEARVFQTQKRDYESRTQQLESMLAAEIAAKEDMMHRMERKLLVENERMRKEKEAELLASQQSMEKHMRKQLDATTQRTVEENERVQIELRFQSTHLEKLLKRMDQLASENRQLHQEKGLFEDMNASLSKKLKFYEQLFAKMQQREEQQQRSNSNQIGATDEQLSPRACRGVTHKPPLPSLTLPTPSPRTLGNSGSPKSCFGGDSVVYGERRGGQEEQGPASLDQVTDMLEKHLLGREFTRKQLAATLEYHHELFQQHKVRDRKSMWLLAMTFTLTGTVCLRRLCN